MIHGLTTLCHGRLPVVVFEITFVEYGSNA